jgi:DDE family transposase
MLSNCHWTQLLCRLRELEPSPKGRGHPVTYPTYLMAWLAVWAASEHWPLRVLAGELEHRGWPRVIRRHVPRALRRRRPDAARLSRRWRQGRFFEMLDRVLIRGARPDRTALIDGMILPVGPHSQDAGAQFGGPGSRFQKGYKSVRVTNLRGEALAVRVVSANLQEATAAIELVPWLGAQGVKLARMVGDRAYDSEPLRAEVHRRVGALLVAPRASRGRGKGKRGKSRKGRYRRESMRILKSPWGRHWMKARGAIERSHGWLRQRPHELGILPTFIRTPARVRRWVVCHEVLLSIRKRGARTISVA